MIVQCEQCRTKFRLDDGKVSDRGVKVRCAKCRHVFTVQREEASAESSAFAEEPTVAAAPVEDVWAPALETADATIRMAPSPSAEPDLPSFEQEPAVTFDFGEIPLDAASPAPAADAAEHTGFGEGAPETAPSPFLAEATPSDSVFDLGQTDAAAGAVDFSDLSFGAGSAASADQAAFGDATMVMAPGQQTPEPAAPAPEPVPDTPFGEFDFSATAPAAEELPPPLPEPPEEVAVSTAHLTGEPELPASQPEPDTAAAPVDTFGLADIAFEGEPAPDQTAPAPAEPAPAAAPAITFAAPDQTASPETPPLAITSRRRHSPFLSSLIAVVTVLVVGVLGFMTYTHLSDGPGVFTLFDKPRVPAEEGRIAVQKISAYYLDKTAAGELLVITGEAVNQFTKPRASLQLKATVFAGDGTVLTSKTAYAGNQLTRDQLLTMPADKIETTMGNQFGDSLINMEVQPGKGIPFTIVIVNPPKDGRDFGVEAAGSTVAASK